MNYEDTEYEARGKNVEDGNWIYGDLLHGEKGVTLLDTIDSEGNKSTYEVARGTVGFCVGKTKTGNEYAFVNDIIEFKYKNRKGKEYANRGIIRYIDGGLRVISCDREGMIKYTKIKSLADMEEAKIIGNVHDNKEIVQEIIRDALGSWVELK